MNDYIHWLLQHWINLQAASISIGFHMQFRFSDVVDPTTYETEGLCDGIPLRKAKETLKENLGAVRLQKDWNKHVGPLRHYRGGMGPVFNVIQVTIPECLPDRVETLTYSTEFTFLYDGIHLSLHHLIVLIPYRRYRTF